MTAIDLCGDTSVHTTGDVPGTDCVEGCDDRKCFRTGCNLLAVVQVIAQVACVVTFCCKYAQTCT